MVSWEVAVVVLAFITTSHPPHSNPSSKISSLYAIIESQMYVSCRQRRNVPRATKFAKIYNTRCHLKGKEARFIDEKEGTEEQVELVNFCTQVCQLTDPTAFHHAMKTSIDHPVTRFPCRYQLATSLRKSTQE